MLWKILSGIDFCREREAFWKFNSGLSETKPALINSFNFKCENFNTALLILITYVRILNYFLATDWISWKKVNQAHFLNLIISSLTENFWEVSSGIISPGTALPERGQGNFIYRKIVQRKFRWENFFKIELNIP